MLASERMAKRCTLVERLAEIDRELQLIFGQPPSTRVSSIARKRLSDRAEICDELLQVGYQPGAVPISMDESKAV